MAPKFQPGDLARIGNRHRAIPEAFSWLRVGRIVKIIEAFPKGRGRHTIYAVGDRRMRGTALLDARQLRTPDQPFMPRGPHCGRPKEFGT